LRYFVAQFPQFFSNLLSSSPMRAETVSAHDKSTTTKRTGESFPILPWSAKAGAYSTDHRRWLFENSQTTLRATTGEIESADNHNRDDNHQKMERISRRRTECHGWSPLYLGA
jgi:hypothetical protein